MARIPRLSTQGPLGTFHLLGDLGNRRPRVRVRLKLAYVLLTETLDPENRRCKTAVYEFGVRSSNLFGRAGEDEDENSSRWSVHLENQLRRAL